MPLNLKQFRQQLVTLGLISADELAELVDSLDPQPVEIGELSQALISKGLLTKFQTQAVAQGKGKSLSLGVYRIKSKIGAGGMGQVYLAEHQKMKREVAIKVLPPEMVKNKAAVQRFHREVQAAAQLNHKNIVTSYDANEEQGTHFLVMEHVRGNDLSSTVKKNGPLSIELTLDVIKQAAEGLAYAHAKGIIHRDIKLANLLLNSEGVVKILDMGLARIESPGVLADDEGLTGAGMMMGTVDFVSPEQALDTRTADARSDIYSLGVSLFYLLTGRPLYLDDTVMKKLLALQKEPPPTLATCREGIPPEVESLFQRMVAKKPAERFQSMSEVVSAIDVCSQLLKRGSDGSESAELRAIFQSQTMGESFSFDPDSSDFGERTDQSGASGRRELSLFAGTIPRWKQLTEGKKSRNRILMAGFASMGVTLLLLFLVQSRSHPKEPTRTAIVSPASDLQQESPHATIQTPPQAAQTPGEESQPSEIEQPNRVLEFDGQNDSVLIPDLRLQDYDALTIEGFVTPYSLPQSGKGWSTIGGVVLDVRLINRQESFWEFDIQAKRRGVKNPISDQPAVAGRQVHLAIVWDGKQVTGFVDGIPQGEPAEMDDLKDAQANNLVIGATRFNSNFFHGTFDELRYSRVARYSGKFEPQTRFGTDDDTIALYHCDESDGTTLVDSSKNKLHGEIRGGARFVVPSDAPAQPIAEQPAYRPPEEQPQTNQ